MKQEHNEWFVQAALRNAPSHVLYLDGPNLNTTRRLVQSGVDPRALHVPNHKEFKACSSAIGPETLCNLYSVPDADLVQTWRKAVARGAPLHAPLRTCWLDRTGHWNAGLERLIVQVLGPELLGRCGGDLFVTAAVPRSPHSIAASKCRGFAEAVEWAQGLGFSHAPGVAQDGRPEAEDLLDSGPRPASSAAALSGEPSRDLCPNASPAVGRCDVGLHLPPPPRADPPPGPDRGSTAEAGQKVIVRAVQYHQKGGNRMFLLHLRVGCLEAAVGEHPPNADLLGGAASRPTGAPARRRARDGSGPLETAGGSDPDCGSALNGPRTPGPRPPQSPALGGECRATPVGAHGTHGGAEPTSGADAPLPRGDAPSTPHPHPQVDCERLPTPVPMPAPRVVAPAPLPCPWDGESPGEVLCQYLPWRGPKGHPVRCAVLLHAHSSALASGAESSTPINATDSAGGLVGAPAESQPQGPRGGLRLGTGVAASLRWEEIVESGLRWLGL